MSGRTRRYGGPQRGQGRAVGGRAQVLAAQALGGVLLTVLLAAGAADARPVDTEAPSAAQAETALPETALPGATQPGTTQPGTTQPETAQPAQAPAGDGATEVRPLQLHTEVSPDRVPLGQPFLYEVTVTHPVDHRYELAAGEDLGAFELLAQERRREDVGSTALTRFRLRLALYELGTHALPTLPFEVATAEGPRRFLLQGERTVEGLSSLPPDAQGVSLRDLKPPEDVPIRSWRLLWGLAGVLAAAALGWALWRWRRRPRAAETAPVAPLLPLEERTLQALHALRDEQLPAQGRHKEFYSRLTDILRGYLGERYRFEARECTTPELLGMLAGLNTGAVPLDRLRDLLDEADLVKFAKLQVDASACDAALAFGHRLVTVTTPQPPPPPGTQPGPRPGAPTHAPRPPPP